MSASLRQYDVVVIARILVSLVVLFLAQNALAERLFAATLRPPSGASDRGGRFFAVDLKAAGARMIGPLLVDGTQPIGLTGLAFQPGSNRLFGITAGIVEGLRPVLVSIDPSTAEARVIGRLTHPLTDISFAPNGQLYGWTADTGQLGLVDTQNGKVTPIGAAREPPVGGGFAIDGLGNAFVAAGNAADTIDQVDLQSGAVSPGPTIRDAPYLSAIGAMAFSPSGELYAANSIRSTPIKSILLTIDRGSGVTHVVGDLPEDTDAIAFTSQEPMLRTTIMRSVSYLAIAVFVVLAFFFLRSRVVKRGRA